MSKPAKAVISLPGQVKRSLVKLGADLRIARERRGESLRAWASRIDISVPTLQRMEAGDPSVGVSSYAIALWLIGRSGDLENLADPAKDQQALSFEIMRSARYRKK